MRGALGMEGNLGLLPAHREVAESLGATPTGIAHAIRRLRERWNRQRWMTRLRDSVAALVAKHGGVMTVRELAEALAATRGSTETGAARLRRAGAVAAAALEMESAREDSRFRLHRRDASPGASALVLATDALDPALTASVEARADWVRELGKLADDLAEADPLLPPARVTEALAEGRASGGHASA